MDMLFNIEKWNTYLNAHETQSLTILAIISIILFFALFFIVIKQLNESDDFETETSVIVRSFFVSLVCATFAFIILVLLSKILGVIIIGISLFGVCFGIGKLIFYLLNKPKKQKIELPNLSDIAKGVYDAMLEINPDVKYEDIYASIEKKFSK